jgi:hypothetical protein
VADEGSREEKDKKPMGHFFGAIAIWNRKGRINDGEAESNFNIKVEHKSYQCLIHGLWKDIEMILGKGWRRKGRRIGLEFR